MRWRRTEITIETHQMFVLKTPASSAALWCRQCPERSRMIRPDDAAFISGSGTREIYRWLDTRGVHFVETREGAVLVCLNSLLTAQNAEGMAASAESFGHTSV